MYTGWLLLILEPGVPYHRGRNGNGGLRNPRYWTTNVASPRHCNVVAMDAQEHLCLVQLRSKTIQSYGRCLPMLSRTRQSTPGAMSEEGKLHGRLQHTVSSCKRLVDWIQALDPAFKKCLYQCSTSLVWTVTRSDTILRRSRMIGPFWGRHVLSSERGAGFAYMYLIRNILVPSVSSQSPDLISWTISQVQRRGTPRRESPKCPKRSHHDDETF
jgi:hypothetical protein